MSQNHRDPAAPGSIPCIPKKFSLEKIANVAEVNHQHCLEESGQWLENVDQTHLVMASGKLVLQNNIVLAFTKLSFGMFFSHLRSHWPAQNFFFTFINFSSSLVFRDRAETFSVSSFFLETQKNVEGYFLPKRERGKKVWPKMGHCRGRWECSEGFLSLEGWEEIIKWKIIFAGGASKLVGAFFCNPGSCEMFFFSIRV